MGIAKIIERSWWTLKGYATARDVSYPDDMGTSYIGSYEHKV